MKYIDEVKINYRFPWEFYGYGNNVIKAIAIWLFYSWNSNMCDIYQEQGIRILGIEVVGKKYL